MRSLFTFLAACSAILLTVQSAIIPSTHSIYQRNNTKSPAISTIFQLPNKGSWIENLSVRSNGDLLVTRLDVPEVWSVDPSKGLASLVSSIPNASGLLGITEICSDVFAIVAGVISLSTGATTPGSFVIWKLDMRPSKPTLSIIKAMPEAIFLNGMTTFSENSDLVLIADSAKGVIWSLNTRTGEYSVALSDPTMLPAAGAHSPIGINGVKVRNGYVYYTSSTQGIFCRVPVNAQASATGAFETIASGLFGDDFILASDGTAYIAVDPQNEVVKVTPEGQVSVIAGSENSSVIAGPTACQFGWTEEDEDVLYFTTNGGQAAPVNGTFIEPGKVVAIRLG